MPDKYKVTNLTFMSTRQWKELVALTISRVSFCRHDLSLLFSEACCPCLLMCLQECPAVISSKALGIYIYNIFFLNFSNPAENKEQIYISLPWAKLSSGKALLLMLLPTWLIFSRSLSGDELPHSALQLSPLSTSPGLMPHLELFTPGGIHPAELSWLLSTEGLPISRDDSAFQGGLRQTQLNLSS